MMKNLKYIIFAALLAVNAGGEMLLAATKAAGGGARSATEQEAKSKKSRFQRMKKYVKDHPYKTAAGVTAVIAVVGSSVLAYAAAKKNGWNGSPSTFLESFPGYYRLFPEKAPCKVRDMNGTEKFEKCMDRRYPAGNAEWTQDQCYDRESKLPTWAHLNKHKDEVLTSCNYRADNVPAYDRGGEKTWESCLYRDTHGSEALQACLDRRYPDAAFSSIKTVGSCTVIRGYPEGEDVMRCGIRNWP